MNDPPPAGGTCTDVVDRLRADLSRTRDPRKVNRLIHAARVAVTRIAGDDDRAHMAALRLIANEAFRRT